MFLNPFRSVYRRFFALLFGTEVTVRGRCKQCGKCCESIILRMDGRWINSRRRFRNLVQREPEYGRLIPDGEDDYGNIVFTCSWLTEDKVCKDHENRLELCHKHPGKGFYFSGSNLESYCGYRLEARPTRWLFIPRRIRKFEDVLEEAAKAEKVKTGNS